MLIQGKRSKRQNIIAAVMTFEGSCDRSVFETYIREVLCPVLRKGQVIIMDNASFHKLNTITPLIESCCCSLMESRPKELPHQPLAERCVNLSIHTAPSK